jgi:xanthine dehydrogenase small subunit
MIYKAVDSCLIFLPMVHGKQVITIENLAVSGKILHPVQQALVEKNGIQCGYCTPGMVMSLFALFKNHHQPSREVIGDALAGNLCRCTGYQSIIEAAEKACSGHGADHFSEKERDVSEWIKMIRADREPIRIGSGKQTYFKPFTLKEALRLRKENPGASLIQGSTDISLRQTKNNETLPKIIDLSGIDELSFINEGKERIIIGAGTSLERIKQYSEAKLIPLNRILKVFGSLQIRNLATIGGNIGSASPIGDMLPLLFALNAGVTLTSMNGSRTIPISTFITGYRKTILAKDELITGVAIPLPDPGLRISAFKVSRRKDLDISTVSAAFRIRVSGGMIKDIALVYGGMAAMVKHARKAEAFLEGKPWNRDSVEGAMRIVENEFEPITDARSGAGFRRKAAAGLLMKFYLETSTA